MAHAAQDEDVGRESKVRLQGSVEAAVRIEREVLADDLGSGKLLLESEVYGTLHGIAGVKAIRIEHIVVSNNVPQHGEDRQAQRERAEEREFLPSQNTAGIVTPDDISILRQLPAFVRGLGLGSDPDGTANWASDFATRLEPLVKR